MDPLTTWMVLGLGWMIGVASSRSADLVRRARRTALRERYALESAAARALVVAPPTKNPATGRDRDGVTTSPRSAA